MKKIGGLSLFLVGLVIQSFSASPDLTSFLLMPPFGTYKQGDTLSGNVNVSNMGDASASSGYADIFLNKDFPSYSGGNMVDWVSYGAIAPGGSNGGGFSYDIPMDAPPGTYYLTCMADSTHTSTESNEENNTYHKIITILEAAKPDLMVDSISIVHDYRWQSATITAVITNVGVESALFESSQVMCRFDIDGQQIDFGTTSSELILIGAGGHLDFTETVDIPGLGNYTVLVEADPDGILFESNEANNLSTNLTDWSVAALADEDGDGMVDFDEIIAGSNPFDTTNIWKCAAASTNSGFLITWPSISNRWYAVERATDLTEGFSVIATNLPATPPENSYLDSTTSNAFYRIEVNQ